MAVNIEINQINFGRAVTRGLTKSGLIIEGDARLYCPVGQYNDGRVGGYLRNTIGSEVIKYKLRVGANAFYSPYVEKGTRKMQAQPFIRPAFSRNMQKAQEIIVEEIEKEG